MAEFPAMPLWTDAYLGDTTHLTATEHGAYLLLLITMWRTPEKRLPTDDAKLARYARLTKGQWARMKPTIMAFFNSHGDWITQGRLTDEANAVKRNSSKQSDKSKARWLKTKKTPDAVDKPEPCRTDASLTLPTPKKDPDANASAEPIDPAKVVFQQGLRMLTASGVLESHARPMLGRWRKDHGDAALIEALHKASAAGALDPVAYIQGVFRKKAKTNDNRTGNAFVNGAAELLREIESQGGGGAGRQRTDDVSGGEAVLPGRLEIAGVE